MVLIAALFCGCSGARLSHNEVRKQIGEIGSTSLIPESIQIQRIVSQSDRVAIAETTVSLAFQFKRNKPSDKWHIEAVRLGDRNWVSVDELVTAVNEQRRRTTMESLQKLTAGIAAYRQRTGQAPSARDLAALNDLLHPTDLTELIVNDAWGRAIRYETSGAVHRLVSVGSDGVAGTSDDVVLVP